MQDLLTPPDHSEEIVRLVPGAEHVVINEAGHIIMLEHPEVVTGLLLSLIERGLRAADEGIARRAQAAGAPHRHRPRQAPQGGPGPRQGRAMRPREVVAPHGRGDAGVGSTAGTRSCGPATSWSSPATSGRARRR